MTLLNSIIVTAAISIYFLLLFSFSIAAIFVTIKEIKRRKPKKRHLRLIKK